MKIYTFYLLTFFALLFPLLVSAQSGTTAAGNSVSNSNYQIGFTIGENIISTYSDGETSITHGIIQPTKVVIISTDDFVENGISVYPNPATSILNIASEDQDLISFEVYSIESKKVQEGLIENDQVDISLLIPGLYIIKLRSSQKTFSTLIKIINI